MNPSTRSENCSSSRAAAGTAVDPRCTAFVLCLKRRDTRSAASLLSASPMPMTDSAGTVSTHPDRQKIDSACFWPRNFDDGVHGLEVLVDGVHGHDALPRRVREVINTERPADAPRRQSCYNLGRLAHAQQNLEGPALLDEFQHAP